MDYDAAFEEPSDNYVPTANLPAARGKYNAELLKVVFERFEPHILNMERQVAELLVDGDEAGQRAGAMAAELSQLANRLEKKRVEVTEPHMEVVRGKAKIDAVAKAMITRIKTAQGTAERKNTAYLVGLEIKRQAAIAAAKDEQHKLQEDLDRQAQEKADAAAKEGIVLPPEEAQAPKAVFIPEVVETTIRSASGSQSLEFKLVPTLTNFRDLSDECLDANRAKLEEILVKWANKQIKAGIKSIPGFAVNRVAVAKTRAARS